MDGLVAVCKAASRRRLRPSSITLRVAMPKRAAAAAVLTPSPNEAALLLKLKELTGGVDAESDDAWLDSLVVTAKEPLSCSDPNDDLKRELAL